VRGNQLNYYRLKQTDYDGDTAVFDPVVLNNNGIQYDGELLIFPNPSDGVQVTIFLADFTEEEVDVQLISTSGICVLKKTIDVSEGGLAVLVFDNELAAGLYTLKVNGAIEKLISRWD